MRLEINDRRGQERGGRYAESPPNFGSARSDYGDRAYGGSLNERGMDRDWWDKTADEVSSWFGDDEAERRRRLDARRNAIREHNRRRLAYGGGYPLGFSQAGSYREDWHELRVGDVMTRDIASVHPVDNVQLAARLMGDYDCGAIPVVDRQNRPIGMITDRDIAIRAVANGLDPAYMPVGDLMTHEAFACHVNDSLVNCMRSMSRHRIRRMPIVDDRNRIVGIVSQSDLAQHASENAGLGERRAVSDVVCAVSEPSTSSYS